MATSFRPPFVPRRCTPSGLALITVATALAVASPAAAQQQDRIAENNGAGADLHLFRPALDARGFFSVNGAGVLPHNTASFGLVLDYGRQLLRIAPGHGSKFMV